MKTSVYIASISAVVLIFLTWPLLKAFNQPTELINTWGYILMAIIGVKCIFDTVNLSILRALWSTGDLYFPLIVSIFTMYFGQVAIPFIFIYGFNILHGLGLVFAYIGYLVDPFLRAMIYPIRWIKGTWRKKVRLV
ncbi:hypothetical protein [Spiroplasma endosymbiont of Labia minor]|uniref:hypothetical protein n=1 Tax=Spiroplasma endosymbiont of Labia minor TaxID=3066305 RepID=UPI0030CC130C